ncbi:transcription factor bHLH18-like [Musa acuminata AAA Group]|uniref:transcription factor bHLH18-like n=1 Tax=Musa acuminata AAA Group TaxID=214697 RepID=UPI0031D8CE5E
MEALPSPGYSDMGMDHSFFNQWDLTALDHYSTPVALGRDLDQSPSSESYTSYPSSHPQASTVRPNKLIKTSSWKSCATEQNSAPEASCPRILSFGNPESPICQYGSHAATGKTKEEADGSIPKGSKRNYDTMFGDGTKSGNTGVRSASHNQEHIMAERKRREKLSQRFIELSAVVPGLKKMDKASVLSDAIKYLKQLQENVKALEDQVAKRNVESAVLVKKYQLCADDDSSSCTENFNERQSGESLPEIEARVCEKTILIRIHCENRKGVLVKALCEIEKLHLSVMNTSVMPFAGSSLDITVMTQTEEEFSMTAKDIVKKLNSAFREFM